MVPLSDQLAHATQLIADLDAQRDRLSTRYTLQQLALDAKSKRLHAVRDALLARQLVAISSPPTVSVMITNAMMEHLSLDGSTVADIVRLMALDPASATKQTVRTTLWRMVQNGQVQRNGEHYSLNNPTLNTATDTTPNIPAKVEVELELVEYVLPVGEVRELLLMDAELPSLEDVKLPHLDVVELQSLEEVELSLGDEVDLSLDDLAKLGLA